jgi:hypothetical protein
MRLNGFWNVIRWIAIALGMYRLLNEAPLWVWTIGGIYFLWPPSDGGDHVA